MPRVRRLSGAIVSALDGLAIVPGWPGYLVSSEGRVFTCWMQRRRGPPERGSIRVLTDAEPREVTQFDRKRSDGSPSGYRSVHLYRDGAGRNLYVHELVMLAFVGPRPSPELEILHGNGRRDDNRLENLRYGTVAENVEDKRRHGSILSGDRHWTKRRARAAPTPTVDDYAGAFDDLLSEGAA